MRKESPDWTARQRNIVPHEQIRNLTPFYAHLASGNLTVVQRIGGFIEACSLIMLGVVGIAAALFVGRWMRESTGSLVFGLVMAAFIAAVWSALGIGFIVAGARIFKNLFRLRPGASRLPAARLAT